MKNLLQALIKFTLKVASRLVLARHRPIIVSITGSVGKSSTKEALAALLKLRFSVRRSPGNLNNEYGVPLTILGGADFDSILIRLFGSVFGFFWSLLRSNYPKILVLEMAADRKGDITYLTSIAKPTIAVVTRIGVSHIEYFGDVESIQKEKSQLVKALTKEGVAVLNIDDPRVMMMKPLSKGQVITYGFDGTADVRAERLSLRQESDANLLRPDQKLGSSFELVMGAARSSIYLPGILGRAKIYTLLAGAAVATSLNIKKDDIVTGLKSIAVLPGRLRILSGIKHTIILDDTYNSSPESTMEAMQVLKQIHARRRIAVLGDMLELGPATERAHRQVGRLVRDLGIDLLYTVGSRSNFTAEEARISGMAKTKVIEFERSIDAGVPVQNRMQEGDVVLVKGSQGMRMEKIVQEIMAEPKRAGELLCRQSESWLKKSVESP